MLDKRPEFKIAYYTRQQDLSLFGKRIEQIGQQAVSQAIAQHKTAGNPIYYKEKGRLIKELPDGTCYLVKASINGITVIRKL